MELLLRTSFDIPKPPGQASAGLFDREYPLRIRISHYIKSFIGAALPCQLAKKSYFESYPRCWIEIEKHFKV